MKKIVLILFLLSIILSIKCEKVSPSSKIKKIILLCLENHSYDNMVII
jgi:hypothetical protein